MPIIERGPWRLQYFEHICCPESVDIPTDDPDCYALFPAHRWVYNKLSICETQQLPHAPHGISPSAFPVFSKPIYNLNDMGAGSRVMHNVEEYQRHLQPGHMWMVRLQGEHVSSDAAIIKGQAQWWRHTVGKAAGDGTFDYWTVLADSRPAIEAYCGAWLAEHLYNYTGMVNVETIGGRIIEMHLRFSDQWPDLYGEGWLEAVVQLYAKGEWDFSRVALPEAYSVVLFGPHGRHYQPPPPALVEAIKAQPHISSVQITFYPDKPPQAHAMPPGGFRLAVINCFELKAGQRARAMLAEHFLGASRA
ncbi:MAG: hypothetical protein JO089_02840 [Alphaproteobacteria bacterium]|nr:hypothetical protein [Alphaproteobacteria bacterium]